MDTRREHVKIFRTFCGVQSWDTLPYRTAENDVNEWLDKMHPSIDIVRVLQSDSGSGFVITIFYKSRTSETLR
jgi:hypothetical protein